VALTSAPDAAQRPPEKALPPLSDAQWLERLELGKGAVALVSVPLGAAEPRPVMVAVHGSGDRPDWACGEWRGVTDAYPFIVCPEGSPSRGDRYAWGSSAQIQKIIDLALPALRARFGAYVMDGPMLYAGFSAGVIYGAGVVRRDPSAFPRLMLSEGGYDQLDDPAFAKAFATGGGRRVLLGCSTHGSCITGYGGAKRLLERAGVDVRLNDAGNLGHTLEARVTASLRTDWPWLVEGAKGWEGYVQRTVP
jgi:hypothetical protein